MAQSRAEQTRGALPPLDPPCFCSMGHGLLTIDRGGSPLDPHDVSNCAMCFARCCSSASGSKCNTCQAVKRWRSQKTPGPQCRPMSS